MRCRRQAPRNVITAKHRLPQISGAQNVSLPVISGGYFYEPSCHQKTTATPPFSPKKTGYRDLLTTDSNVPPFLPHKPYFLTWATLPGEHRRFSPNIPPIFTGTIAHMQSPPRPDPQTPPPSTFCNVPQTTT